MALQVCRLTRCFRTHDDVLLAALADMRAGLAQSAAIARLVAATARLLPVHNGITPTMLFSIRTNVAQTNQVLRPLHNMTCWIA